MAKFFLGFLDRCIYLQIKIWYNAQNKAIYSKAFHSFSIFLFLKLGIKFVKDMQPWDVYTAYIILCNKEL